MPTHVLILSSGGLRSLVATALTQREEQKTRVSLLHLIDGRDNAVMRMESVRQQAEHFGIARIVELDLPHLYGHGQSRSSDGLPTGTLVGPQTVLAAVAQARQQQIERVVWPVSFDGDDRAMARTTEQVLLLDHLAQVEATPMPRVETPLVEMTDQQIVELGGQMNLPWELAWSCAVQIDKPCKVCPSCRRRKAAFEAAGIVDPIDRRATFEPAMR